MYRLYKTSASSYLPPNIVCFFLQELLGTSDWHLDPRIADCLKSPLMRLCTKYVISNMFCEPCAHLLYMYLGEGGGGDGWEEVAAHWRGSRPGILPVYDRIRESTSGFRGFTSHRGFRSGEFLWKEMGVFNSFELLPEKLFIRSHSLQRSPSRRPTLLMLLHRSLNSVLC